MMNELMNKFFYDPYDVYRGRQPTMCMVGTDLNRSLCGRDVTNEKVFISDLSIQNKPKEIGVCKECIKGLIDLKKLIDDEFVKNDLAKINW